MASPKETITRPSPKDSLLYVLESEEFLAFYQKHIAATQSEKEKGLGSSIDLLESYLQKIKSPECYIAVLGIQKAGKSSLLNALLFSDDVLPVEVQETTCIPTIIRRQYAGEEKSVELHYQDGRVEIMPLSREFLEKVVDNRYNPGNIMQAAFVVCRYNSTLLQEGFVFVDLPGVGSLTAANEETTINFLRQTHVGIFLVRTVPPITESEGKFLRLAWPMVQQSIFVQNLWAQETQQELKEGMEHNVKVLKMIADEKQTRPPQEILPIHVAMACQGTIKNDKELIAQSGIETLRETIRRYAQQSFLEIFYFQTAQFFARLIKRTQDRLEERLAILRSDQAAILNKFDAEKEKFLKGKSDLENRVIAHMEDFLGKVAAIKTDWLSANLEKASQNCLDKLDKAPLEHLTEEDFRQLVRQTCTDMFGIVYKDMQSQLAFCAENYVASLSSTLQEMASLDQVLCQDIYDPKAKDPKAAKGWSVMLTGGLAPIVLASNPVGWGILGGAVLAGGLVRLISGATAHKRIMRSLIKVIGDTRMQMRKELSVEIDHFAQKVADTMKTTVKTELVAYENGLQKIEEDLREALSSKEGRKKELQADLQQAELFFKGLGAVVK